MVKNSFNCKMSYIDYVHVCNTFLVSNNKNISKVKETQDKKLCNLLLRNMGNNSDTCQDPDKVIFNFSSYSLSDYEKKTMSFIRFSICFCDQYNHGRSQFPL